MIGKLDENLSFHSQALSLRSQRQQLLASNIANADTPGYKARDFDFAAALQSATSSGLAPGAMRITSSAHLSPSGPKDAVALQYRVPPQSSLDQNSVDMDAERARFSDNAVRYEASLRFLNQKIKTMLSAIQG